MSDLVIRLARLGGGELVLDAGGLAGEFFRIDPSAVGEGAYDARAGIGAPDRIETEDIFALNRTMRARSPHVHWEPVMGRQRWLSDIPAGLDLIETGDASWASARGDELVRAAIGACVGRGRGVSVATKLLHLKRPNLFPILDSRVNQMLGQPITATTPEGMTEQAVRLALHLRSEGRRNVKVLRAVRKELPEDRSLVRILDAAIWLAHPAAGGVPRTFTVRV